MGVGILFAFFFTIVKVNPLAWVGVAVAGVGACLFGLGIAPHSQDALMGEILEDILTAVKKHAPIQPRDLARLVDWPDAVVLEGVRFLEEEKKVQRDEKGRLLP